MAIRSGKLIDGFHIVWAIAAKDILEALKSRLVVSLVAILCLLVLLPRMLAWAIDPPYTVVAVYDLGRRFFDATAARNGCLLLLCTVQFMLQAKTAQIDMTVCMWITLGNYGLMRHLLQGPAWGWFFGAWIAMGLGVITKGVGFLPVLMLLPCKRELPRMFCRSVETSWNCPVNRE